MAQDLVHTGHLSAQPRASERPPEGIARTPVLGVGISAVSLASATDTVLGWIESGDRTFVAVTGVHGVIEAQDDAEFKGILNQAGMNVPDGMPMVWLSRRAGHPNVTRVFGPDFMLEICAALAQTGGRAFYYGGAPGVADELAREMERSFPGLTTAGTYCPPFRELTAAEEAEVVETIDRAAPDILWVGLSTPKQERWMARFRPQLNVPVLIGVGAAFDYNTGRIKRAPRWMQNSGMEWLYRIMQDPKRLWKRYARNNPLFLFYLACQRLGLRDFG